MEVKLHFKRYHVFTKYKYISQQLKIPTVQQGTTILDVLEPHPPPPHPTLSSPCKLPGTVLADWQGCNWQLKNCCNLRWLKTPLYTFSELLVYLVTAQPHSKSLTFPCPQSLPGGGKMKDTHNEAGNCPDLYALDRPTSSLL